MLKSKIVPARQRALYQFVPRQKGHSQIQVDRLKTQKRSKKNSKKLKIDTTSYDTEEIKSAAVKICYKNNLKGDEPLSNHQSPVLPRRKSILKVRRKNKIQLDKSRTDPSQSENNTKVKIASSKQIVVQNLSKKKSSFTNEFKPKRTQTKMKRLESQSKIAEEESSSYEFYPSV